MLLSAANVGFVAAGFLTCWLARRGGRADDRIACGVVVLLTVGGFLLAHVGMNESWTGDAAITDYSWLRFALTFAAALVVAQLLVRRLHQDRAGRVLLPVAALLVALGLINLYAWSTRDANAYVSTVALPDLRAYERTVAADTRLSPVARAAVLRLLGRVPNELAYERDAANRERGRHATVLNPDWQQRYNAAVRRFESARRLHPAHASVRPVVLHRALRKQVVIAALSLFLVPALLLARTRVRGLALFSRRWPPIALGLLLLAICGAMLFAPKGSGRRPAVVELSGHSVIAYELLKVGLVVLLALGLSRPPGVGRGERTAAFSLAAVACALAALAWQDHGSGLTLAIVAVLVVSLVASARRRVRIAAVGAVLALAAPFAVAAIGSAAPETVRVRLAMWADPFRTYHHAALANQVGSSFERLVRARTGQLRDGRTLASSARPVAASIKRDVAHIEQEFRWRLAALRSSANAPDPFVPRADPVDERVLLEAERLWSELGGYTWAPRSIRAFEEKAGTAVAGLRARADALAATQAEPGARVLAASASAGGVAVNHAAEPDDFQLQRALHAFHAGGLSGRGLGRGRPETVPGLTEDVPLAAVGEALGFGGIALVVLVILMICGRGIEWGRRERRSAPALLLVGLSALLGVQALISLGGTASVLPFTGLTFPFVSRSGSALVTDFLAVGLIVALAPPRGSGAFASGARVRPPLGGGIGLPAAFFVLLASIAVLQVTGRTLTPGALLAPLPGSGSPFLHPEDQWQLAAYRIASGPIVDRRGGVLAETAAPTAGRTYPRRRLATTLAHTLVQLDLSFRAELRETSAAARRDRTSLPVGPTLVTTIDPDIQRAVDSAFDRGAIEAGLADVTRLRGAVIVLDVRTGAILALESRPAFSLDELSDPLAWAQAEARDRRAGFPYRYLNRPILGYYPPGSIFKTITAAAALGTGLHTLRSRDFDYRRGPLGPRPPDGLLQLGRWQKLTLPDGPPITDGNHPNLPLSQWDFSLETAYAWSSNIAFAQMGLQLGARRLLDYAHRFGFERRLTVDGLGSTLSTIDNDVGRRTGSRYVGRTESALARSAFGQGEVQATPLQMALVPAAIAHAGKIMQPYIVAGWKSPDGRWLGRTRPRVFSDLRLHPRTVADLRTMMRSSVTFGWARRAQVNARNAHPGVAGKTGSAEWSKKRDLTHAWFIGYFPVESPRVALAVIVERAGPGPRVGVRIAHGIFGSPALRRYVGTAGGR